MSAVRRDKMKVLVAKGLSPKVAYFMVIKDKLTQRRKKDE